RKQKKWHWEELRIAFQKRWRNLGCSMWMRAYNEQRTHQGRWCYGKTPRQTWEDSVDLAKEKMLAA
ncbi:MAG: hypothetical protein KC588_19675, partial [Nitrospira sp.]|nr:hypothetical protein [Nitrospira sp.]